jgi:hypothetical protein
MASPPTAIVPFPVVIAERPIPLTAKRVTVPVISNSHVASTIKGGVLCPVDREVAVAIERSVPVSVDRKVSVAINRHVVARAKLIRVARTINIKVSRSIHRDISLSIEGSISSRAKLLISLEVPLAHPLQPGIAIRHEVRTSARRAVRPLPSLRSRIVMARAHHGMVVSRPCGPNICRSLRRLRSFRLSIVVLLSPRCERQRETSYAC